MTLVFDLHAPNGLSRHTLGCFPRAHTTGRKILATCQPSGFVFRGVRSSGQSFELERTRGDHGVRAGGLSKQNLRFSPRCLPDLAIIARDFATMRTLAVIFVLALIAIAGGICSDPVLMSGTAPHADPDPVILAVAHAVKSRPESRP